MMNYNEKHTVSLMQEMFNKIGDKDLKSSHMIDFNKEKLFNLVKTSNFDCNHVDHEWKKRFFLI